MKKRIFSGIQPSGNLHIGNYLGAIKNWIPLQDEYDSIFCVVDLHAITVPQDPEQLKKKTIEIAKIYLASGIDPKKCSLFIQSQVSEHAELCWILNTLSKMSDLFRMTQFKDKSGVQIDFENFDELYIDIKDSKTMTEHIDQFFKKFKKTNKPADAVEGAMELTKDVFTSTIKQIHKVHVGLFDYPVLMAADILLYETEVVPVGKDQLQHIELTRTLARRFNDRFGETFIVPKGFTKKESENIMALDDPTKKMSKSAKSEYNYISLIDDADTVRRKIKKAVTDSGSEIVYRDDKPALKNLINIYSLLDNITIQEVEAKYKDKGYADFKTDLAEVVVNFLVPFQARMKELSDEKVLEILREGAEKVRPIAKKKLDEVKQKVGFIF